ncbi:hypothetical protein OG234_00200 [Streptomyces sp. NBC_01420]|uniref:hypothetical protein n=1 Tax=Streptomyces sp. NBC_01420 TaxID=2903858 RepID=UPI003247992D
MSRDFGFKFHLNGEVGAQIVLEHLVRAGWRPNDYGSVNYLVDPDFFDWRSTELENAASAYASLVAAQEFGLPCAIMLTWEDTQIGGSFIFMPSKAEITLSPIINPVLRSDHPLIIDFEWYPSRLIGALSCAGMSGLEIFDFAD